MVSFLSDDRRVIDELEDLHYLDTLGSLLSLLMGCAKGAEILDEE